MPNVTNEFWDSIESTNDRLIELAHKGLEEGILVISRQQTRGRGRQGKEWISPLDSGIYLSLLLRPSFANSNIPLISFAAGVAAAEAIERICQIKIGLKWVNDLIFNGRKLGGILAEMPSQNETGRNIDGKILSPAVVLGLGLNLFIDTTSLAQAPEVKSRIISLDEICGKKVDANVLVAEFCNAFEEQYNQLRHGLNELVLSEWRTRSITLNKRISAHINNKRVEGKACDINDNGALILALDSGERQLLQAGEISIRLEDGSYC